ncbi:MAG: DNA-binding protein [Candidatus Melainabacteria bacterium HGW-Melainabacteria-1]|nr:MAG: DNA-binding protein [Candidatus Melainabacteria bacterium HGW-Melainabacteria-1]
MPVFVDTGAWFALFVPADADHDAARSWFEANDQELLTTDYVLSELLTLMKYRGQFQLAVRFGDALLSQRLARLERVTDTDLHETWIVFQRYADKEWSFVDCSSKVVMSRMGVDTAFAFDHHFEQFGTVTRVP